MVEHRVASALVGRADELGVLLDVVDEAAQGRPGAVFVHGEAGAGKTTLVRAAATQAEDSGLTVLWGTCIRVAAGVTPYLPLLSALDGWMHDAGPELRGEALAAVPGLGEMLPTWSTGRGASGGRLLPVTAALVGWIAERTPVVLVVDDLQWTDPATRDALAYLVASLHRTRVAVLTTHRDSSLGIDHPLQGWLADMRRMPGVQELCLAHLDADQVREQVEQLVGRDPHPGLVQDVVARGAGNPYLTELLLHGVDGSADALPERLPEVLVQAVLAAWHRLSETARRVVKALAVGGRPVRETDVDVVRTNLGLGAADLVAALDEAEGNGILVVRDGRVWFRHPLLAESVVSTMRPGESRPYHAMWAELIEARSGSGLDEVRRQADLARHHEATGRWDDAFRCSVRAADGAQDVRALREVAGHLRLAARLFDRATPAARAPHEKAALLERAARASRVVGESQQALDAWDEAISLLDPDDDPLALARVLVELSDTTWEMGDDWRRPLEWARRACELSRPWPDSREHAEALAHLANCAFWQQEPDEADRCAEEAVAAAHRSGSPHALSAAYASRSLVHVTGDTGLADSEAAVRYGRDSADPQLVSWAQVTHSSNLAHRGQTQDAIELERHALAVALASGATSVATFLGGALARDLVESGGWPEAQQVLRQVLGLAGVANGAANARLGAAQLAVRRGDMFEAEQHLARAFELIPELESRAGLYAPPILSEHLLAGGDPVAALSLLHRSLPPQAVDPRVLDEMLVWAARAAADWADRGRDRRDRDAVRDARAALDRFREGRAAVPTPPFRVEGDEDVVMPALSALFEAEVARCDGVPDIADLWATAVQRCADASKGWERHLAGWRLGQALIATGRTADAAEPLRSSYAFAAEVGAAPLLRRVEDLARVSRVRLDAPRVPTPRSAKEDGPLTGLTQREQEVLEHLVAGRTYAEIAAALVISEKTVSSHVSNLLRKTGTTSRREVAALALRMSETR